jgi:hypothetical protein
MSPDSLAHNPFWFKECFLMPMPIGKRATNLRELLQTLREVDEAVLYYHFLQSRLAITQPAVEYPNDFAFWAATALQDSKLAEKLTSLDPFEYADMEAVRQAVAELLEEYLWDLPSVPWARPGFEFHFCEASTVVMRSHISAHTLREFCEGLRKVGLDSVYYHFLEARWRFGIREKDDFSHWIDTNFDSPDLVGAIRDIDIYFHSLTELRETLIDLIDPFLEEPSDRTE